MIDFLSKLKEYLGWNSLVEFSKKRNFPGHRGISIYEVIAFLIKEMKRDAIIVRSAYVAFSFFLSLFPTLLFFFTIIPFLPIPSFQSTLLEVIEDLIPDNTYVVLQTTIEDIVTNNSAGLLSVSLILAFYYSTSGVLGLMNSFDKALPIFRKRSFWSKQIVAVKIMFLLLVLLVFSVALIIGGEFIIKKIIRLFNYDAADIYFWFNAIRWVITIAVFYFSISLIYYFAPATHVRWNFFSAGSTMATILTILVSIIFTLIINKFGQYNKLYGSIGTILVAQLWIYYNSLSLLIGFELNASIESNKYKQSEENDLI